MPGIVKCTIDGTQFVVDEAVVGVGTRREPLGAPLMNSLTMSVQVRINLNDFNNFPFQTVKKLFEMSKAPNSDNFKPMKIEFFKDNSNDVLCTYSFTGWISSFRASNGGHEVRSSEFSSDKVGGGSYNHILDIELTPITNKIQNHKDVKIGN